MSLAAPGALLAQIECATIVDLATVAPAAADDSD
jgi:hypothetical protein